MPGFKKQTFMKSVLFKHRSIRKFRPTPIPEEVLRECLEAASRASTCGNMQLYSLVVMLGICIGVYLCHQTAKDMGVHDHGSIVWDEFIGMWITLMALPTNDWQWVTAGFVIFRILDMWKPWPIRWFDRNVHGGMGIMIDDIVAGVISAVILYFIGHHWPLGILS